MGNKKYDAWRSPSGLEKIAELYASGMSYKNIAENVIGCSERTLVRILERGKTCLETATKIQEAKVQAAEPLKDAAYACATGDYDYTEETYRPNPETGEMILVERKVKRGQPNPSMLQFMLKNKYPDEYKDKQEIQADGTVTIRFEGGSGGADWDELSG